MIEIFLLSFYITCVCLCAIFKKILFRWLCEKYFQSQLKIPSMEASRKPRQWRLWFCSIFHNREINNKNCISLSMSINVIVSTKMKRKDENWCVVSFCYWIIKSFPRSVERIHSSSMSNKRTNYQFIIAWNIDFEWSSVIENHNQNLQCKQNNKIGFNISVCLL